MPTIYTKDPLGEAIEQQWLGENGVNTGSYANSIGLMNHETRAQATGSRAASTGGSTTPYEPFGFIADLEDRIPLRLEQALGVLGAMLLVALSRQWSVLPPLRLGDSLHAPGVVGLLLAALVGYVIGRVALRLALRLFDIALKLLMAIAIAGAVIGVGYLVLTELAS